MITRKDLKTKPGYALKRGLRASIKRLETRYEMSSEDMERAVKSGTMKETREVGKWLQHHRVLNRLTDMGGTRSRATGASTKTG